VQRHPEKYELGVTMADAKKPEKNIILMNGNTQEQQLTRAEIDKMPQDQIVGLKGKMFYELKAIIVPEITVVLKRKPVPDNLVKREPTSKGK
jgi:hypothetical protein